MSASFIPGLVLTDGVEVDPDLARSQFPSSTLICGEAQVTLVGVPGDSDALYFFNFITRPGSRGAGEARRLLIMLLEMADEFGVTLVTHPDDEWMRDRLVANRGFEVDPEGPTWNGKPYMFRKPSPQHAA